MRLPVWCQAAWQPVALLLLLFCKPLVSADCAPYPIAARLGNVTLSNGQNARGVALSVGTPEQQIAFYPQWPLNNTLVYGTAGDCVLPPGGWTEAGCMTFRGGEYAALASTTRGNPSSNAYPVDSSPFPQMSFVSDTVKINDNVSLTNFPFGIPLSDWDEQAYHPMMAIGMGGNSTLMNALKDSGRIATRAWGMFYGRTGANANTQLDGSMVFGGYDKAKVTGPGYTQPLIYNPSCATQMLVTITDISVNFPNGTNASLFPKALSNSISACIVPDYPVLMTMPLNPYFGAFETLTNVSMTERSFGPNFYSMRYSDSTVPFGGDMTFTLQSGLSIRIPNDQLVVPDETIDVKTGAWVVNATDPNLIINPIQDVNANDLSQLGRQFLSAAYLMVNQDAGDFTLWAANPTADEDLVAIDAQNKEVTSFCTAPVGQSTNSPSGNSPGVNSPGVSGQTENKSESSVLPKGAIAGISVGAAVLMFAAVGAVGFCCMRKRRKEPPAPPPAQSVYVGSAPPIYYSPANEYKVGELQDFSRERPCELERYEDQKPLPDHRHELP